MTTETMTEVTDDLDAFSKEMFGEPPAPEPKAEPVEQTEEAAEEVAEAEETTGEEGEEKPERRKLSTTDRINKMTRRMREAEARAADVDSLRAELAALKAQTLTPKPEAGKVEALGEPDAATYQYGELDPQYMRDLARFEAKQETAQLRASLKAEAEQETRQSAAQREHAAFQEAATKIEQAGVAKFSDFDELVIQGAQDGDFELTKEMALALTDMPDAAPDILYYLATYPEESARVAAMSERRQAMWFGRMEAELTAKAAPPARKITQAGAPPASLPKGSGSRGGPSLYDLDDPRALAAMTKALFGK